MLIMLVVNSWRFLQAVSLSPFLPLSAVTLPHLESQAIFTSLHSGVLKHKSDDVALLRRAFQGHHCWDVLTPDLASREPDWFPAPLPHPSTPSPSTIPRGVLPGLHRSFRVSLSTLPLGSFPPLLIPSCFGGRDWFPDLSVSLV